MFYQPGGEKGIIRWSLLLSLLLLSLIIQFEIFKDNIIAPIIAVIAIILIIWFILKSYLIVNSDQIIFHNPLKKKNRIINLTEIESVTTGKFHVSINFRSTEFFPIRLIIFPKNVTILASKLKK